MIVRGGTAQIALPPKLLPVFAGEAYVRGAWGGRGSAKTRSFATMTAVRAYMWAQELREGIILCAREFMNSLADSSFAEIKAAIQANDWLKTRFEIGAKFIRTVCGRISYVFSGLHANLDSIKSKARILLCWVDEAEPVTEKAWEKLLPTLREEDSELWVTWNPERKNSATHKRFRLGEPDPMVKIVEMNWRDNPRFPKILERLRLKDQRERPDSYDHIWEGAMKTIVEGAYYAKSLSLAKVEGRIGIVPVDPLLTIRLFADIGGTGAKADNFVFWAAQFVGLQIRVLDHYEVQGQDLATHMAWLRARGYTPERAQIWLPHDGATQDKVFAVSYESAFKSAGYKVTVVPNQGKGAAGARIDEARRLFPAMWFHTGPSLNATLEPIADATEAGRDALGWYHEKRDPDRGDVGLGPEHDWASHSSDAFGLMAVAHQPPKAPKKPQKKTSTHAASWMAN